MKLKNLLMGLVTLVLFAVPISSVLGAPTWLVGSVLLLGSMVPIPAGALATAIKVTDLNTKLGDYLREHEDILISETLLDQPFADRIEIMDDIVDEFPLPSLEIIDLVKPGANKDFQPTPDALKFDARILKVHDAKVDLELVPSVLHKTWLGKFKKTNSADPFDMPYEEYVMNYIIGKVKENILLNGLFRGTYNAAGTTSIDSMNGFLYHIQLGIAQPVNPIVPRVTGVITESNVVEKILFVYDGLSEAYKSSPTMTYVNPTIFDWYVRKHSALINPSLVSTDVTAMARVPMLNRMPIFGTNSILVREPGLGTSQRIICTPMENMTFGTESMGDTSTMIIQPFERKLKLMMDFRLGTQLKQIHGRCLAVNEQA